MMRNYAALAVAAMMSLTPPLMAHTCPSAVVSVADLTEEALTEFYSGGEKTFVIELPEGAEVPFSFFLKGDLLELQGAEETDCCLHLRRTVYLRWENEGFLFSLDAEEWHLFEDFVQGQLSASMILKSGELRFELAGELNAKAE